MQMTKLLANVCQTLEAKFGLTNDAMTRRTKSEHYQFYDTSVPRVKVCVQHCFNKVGEATSVYVSVAVDEEGDRKGMFFGLGDRLHFDLEKFPQFKFHRELADKLSTTSARVDKFFAHDALAYAKELTEKL